MFNSHNADSLNEILGISRKTVNPVDNGCSSTMDTIAPVAPTSMPEVRAVCLTPKQIIFNPPATIVYWDDGDKTVVRCDNDAFSEEFGYAMACMRKIYGTRANFKALLKDAYRPQEKKETGKSKKTASADTTVKMADTTVRPVKKGGSQAPSLDKLLKELAGDDSIAVGIAFHTKDE